MAEPDLAHFKSIPWCNALLTSPQHVLAATGSRTPKPSTEDELFAATLRSPRTIPACISFYTRPTGPDARIEEVTSLLTLEAGLNGYAGVCHGGIIATLLDEVMGLLLTLQQHSARGDADIIGKSTLTAELVVRYLKPVLVPQTVCIVCNEEKIDGRKVWLVGTIKDHSGTELAKGRGLFIRTARPLL
jgi:acyl-coenzyme A thioesterase PaaI-like protein